MNDLSAAPLVTDVNAAFPVQPFDELTTTIEQMRAAWEMEHRFAAALEAASIMSAKGTCWMGSTPDLDPVLEDTEDEIYEDEVESDEE